MDTYKDAVPLNDLWASGDGAVAVTLSASPRPRHRRLRPARPVAGARAARARRPRRRRCAATCAPVSGLALEGLERAVTVVRGDVLEPGLVAARARRVRGRHRLPPRRPDAGRHRAHRARGRPSRPTSAARGRCWRRAGRSGSPRTVVASSDKAYGTAERLPYREDDPAARALPLRRQQGRGRHDRAQLLAHLRPAGGGHALREPLRRRRPQPLAPGPRGGRRRARRPRAGDPLRRHARARLPLRRGRRRPPTCDRRRARRRPARARRGVQRRRRPPARGARGRRAGLPRRRARTSSPTCAAPARRPARSTASTSTPPSSASAWAGSRASSSRRACERTVAWYRAHPRALAG